jgi:integrase
MTHNIKTVSGRSRIPPRRDPFFEKIEANLYVGWRKMTADGDAHWIARMLDASGKRVFKALGVLEDHPDGERWTVAKRQAEAWAQHVATGGITEPKTVAEACDAYVAHLRAEKGEAAAADAARRFKQYVTDDARFAALELSKLTPPVMQAWRAGLASRPVHRSGRGKAPAVSTDKPRSPSSLNRDMTPFRAALNHAFEQKWVTSDFAWKSALKPIKDADKRREGYLDMTQRRRLIEAAPAGLSDFVRVLAQLPVRPGALAALTVGDFDPRLAQINIVLDKTGPRKITIPPHIAALFAQACRSKLPAHRYSPGLMASRGTRTHGSIRLKRQPLRLACPLGLCCICCATPELRIWCVVACRC